MPTSYTYQQYPSPIQASWLQKLSLALPHTQSPNRPVTNQPTTQLSTFSARMPHPLPHNTLYKVFDPIYPLAFYTTSYSSACTLQSCGHIVEPAGIPIQPVHQAMTQPIAQPIPQLSSRHFCQPVFRDHTQTVTIPIARKQQLPERSLTGQNGNGRSCAWFPEVYVKVSGSSRCK